MFVPGTCRCRHNEAAATTTNSTKLSLSNFYPLLQAISLLFLCVHTMNTFCPIYLKYPCKHFDAWHSHRLTERDVLWHNISLNAEVSLNLPKSLVKLSMGNHFGWYIGVKQAMVELQRYKDGKPTNFFVCVKHHPFSDCCAENVDIISTYMLDFMPYTPLHPTHCPMTRNPLNPIHCQNQKNDNGAHGRSALVVKEAAAVKVACEPLAKAIPSMQIQAPVQSQKAPIVTCDNDDIYMDENDTQDDHAHFPQHFHITSRPATSVKKLKTKK